MGVWWSNGCHQAINNTKQSNEPKISIRCFDKPFLETHKNHDKKMFYPKRYSFDTPIFKKHQDKVESWVEKALKLKNKLKYCYNHSYMASYYYE